MGIVFCIIIVMVGVLLGSFYATQIKRISKEKPVFSIHSYCPKCGKKLGILQKIPIISYIALKGKCKHCMKNIDLTYIILETITGIVFGLTAMALKLDITNINMESLTSFIFIVLYYTYIILSIGIDLEKKEMNQSIMAYGVVISIIYMIYLWLNNSTTIYINTIYLIIIILLLLLNILKTKKTAQSSYVLDLLMMTVIMNIFTNEIICILTIVATLLTIAIYVLINKLRNRKQRDNGKFSNNIKIVSVMGILNILIFLVFINV